MEDIIDIIVTETTNLIEITSQPTDEIIDVNIIDNREDVTLNVTPTVVEININSLTGNFGVNWGEITGTLSNQTDLQNALNAKLSTSTAASTYVPYTGATGNVNLGLDYSLTAALIIKSGGTSTQFLKADGSIDTNTYATTSQLHNPVTIGTANGLSLSTQVLSLGLASSSTNGALSSADWTTFNSKQAALSGSGFVKSTGGTISYDTNTYLTTSAAASTYVPYIGANAHLNMGVNYGINSGQFLLITKDGANTLGNTSYFGITDTAFNNGVFFQLNTSNNLGIYGKTSGTGSAQVAYISRTGDIGANGFIKTGGTSSQFLKADGSVDSSTYLTGSSVSGYVTFWDGSNSVTGFSGFTYNTSTQLLTVQNINSTGTIIGGSFVKTSGTSSQFLKADGSVDSSTYLTTSSASSTYLPLAGGTLTGGLIGTSATFSALLSGGNSSPNTSYNAGSWFNGNGLVVGSISTVNGIQINSSTTSTLSAIRFGDGDGANNLYDQGFIIYNHSVDRMSLGANRGSIMHLVGGSLLIGTTGNASGSTLLTTGAAFADRFRINDTAGGFVTLEMENSTRWRINYLGRFGGYGAGALTTDASGNITAASDRRLKDVIKPIENVLENIMDFEPVYFKWNDKTDLDKENVYMSTIAQSIELHYPDAIGHMPDGSLTVQDRAVTAILVQAIKELKLELDTLKNK